jgi:hypothetical protein
VERHEHGLVNGDENDTDLKEQSMNQHGFISLQIHTE